MKRSIGLQPIGQTLLESLLAIAIILIGLVSVSTLLINVMSTSNIAVAETRMTQLAQEALEGARFVRDSNWLKREDGVSDASTGRLIDYANGLRSSNDTTAIYIWDPAETNPDSAIQFNFTPNSLTDTTARVYQDSAGYFRQSTGTVPADWKVTQFRRLVTLQPICFNITESDPAVAETVAATSCGSGNIEIGMQITVQISDGNANTAAPRTFVEKLYNWKYADTQVIP